MTDGECQLNYYCWYKTPADAISGHKKCMKMFSQDVGTEFGYLKQEEDNFDYKMRENLKYGRYCKSSIAKIEEATNTMSCVEIKQIKTNLDSFASNQEKPFLCTLDEDDDLLAQAC
mmetsp:Transcript_24574/g.38129  ORF Transcript_24574/g.38129 Transcript_24574/m.38129 type:complete len:116 (+) Transcript_24574:542-889(+)